MLERVTFGPKMKKSAFKKRIAPLTDELVLLQQQAKRDGLGTIIVVEGWGSAGKGSRISDLVVDLDPRLFDVYTTEDPIGYESRLPLMARFWSRIAPRGTMTIFDQAWYEAVVRAMMDDIHGIPTTAGLDRLGRLRPFESTKFEPSKVGTVPGYAESIRAFESQLAEDGFLIIKFFLHITEEEQRHRFINLMLDPETSWRVEPEDIRQVQRYSDYYRAFDRLLDLSDRPHAPWTVIPAHDKRTANLLIMETIVNQMRDALEKRREKLAEQERSVPFGSERDLEGLSKEERLKTVGSTEFLSSRHKLIPMPPIASVSHDLAIEDYDDYKKQLKSAQKELSRLQKIIYRMRIPMILVYEGWDAAGKGGNIKRLASALDARSYVVHPISAPTKEELARPFLWRFWTKLPRTGHMSIFDRSWYGRVMVERVEGFAREDEWMRAYDEINDFEAELARWGAIIVKFWINVSSDEQLRRFKEREKDPVKTWKITDEDWRNREKSDLYEVTIDDMLRLTSTETAPWHIIESDNKRYARVKAINIVIDAIKERLYAMGYLEEDESSL